jgi:hypothetical protein
MYGRTYYDGGCVNSGNNGWSALFAAGVGAVGGYLLARNNGVNGWNGNCGNGGGCQTCFQQGEYTGENRAGINYIAQTVNGNSNAIKALGDTLMSQKITDQANEIQALKTQQIVQNVGCVTNSQLSQVNHTLNSIVTGCGVKSYPGCGCGC